MSYCYQKRPGFIDLPSLREARTAHTLHSLKTRAQPRGVSCILGSFGISPGRVISERETAEEQRHVRIEGTEPDGIFPMLNRFAILTRKSQATAEMSVRRRGIWVELDCLTKRRDRLLGSPFHHSAIAEGDVPPGIAIIERDRLKGVLASRKQSLIAINPAHVRGKHQTKSQQALSRRVVRIGLRGAFERFERRLVFRARQAPEMSLRLRHEFPGSEID